MRLHDPFLDMKKIVARASATDMCAGTENSKGSTLVAQVSAGHGLGAGQHHARNNHCYTAVQGLALIGDNLVER